tara:strand:- start:160 stop:528 length:369 start_codon:yes stop_codon:yes gene_type:complete
VKNKLLFLTFVFFFTTLSAQEKSIDQNQIFKNLRCLVCQGQSISDSNSDFAQTVKLVVNDLIEEGKTEEEIYSFMAEKYGDWIIYKPQLNKQNFMLWFLPYTFLIGGGLIIFHLIRKKREKA